MPLSAADLIYPSGLIKPELLPSDVLIRGPSDTGPGVVEVWLQAAQAATQSEAAQRAYVYGRAYRAVADRLALEYNSETMGRKSRSRAEYQIRHFKALATEQEGLFERLQSSPEQTSIKPRNGARIKVSW